MRGLLDRPARAFNLRRMKTATLGQGRLRVVSEHDKHLSVFWEGRHVPHLLAFRLDDVGLNRDGELPYTRRLCHAYRGRGFDPDPTLIQFLRENGFTVRFEDLD